MSDLTQAAGCSTCQQLEGQLAAALRGVRGVRGSSAECWLEVDGVLAMAWGRVMREVLMGLFTMQGWAECASGTCCCLR
jgi:hypothetical protein